MNSGSIGGYIGLELPQGSGAPQGALAFDLGRHALEAILQARAPRRLLAPRYTCEVLAPAISRSGIPVVLYDLDHELDPVLPPGAPAAGDALLYTNYFGLKQSTVERLAVSLPHLIVDNAQAYYGAIPNGADGFNSCRKFFGVADGAFAVCGAIAAVEPPPAPTTGRYEHLFAALDRGTEAAFPLSQLHEQRLADAPLRGMSPLTAALMGCMDHTHVREVRRRNRDRLHAALKGYNRLPLDPASAEVPMVYPFLCDDAGLRDRLIAARIYTARYWPGLLAPLAPADGARPFAEQVVYLPVDQRYGDREKDRVLEAVLR